MNFDEAGEFIRPSTFSLPEPRPQTCPTIVEPTTCCGTPFTMITLPPTDWSEKNSGRWLHVNSIPNALEAAASAAMNVSTVPRCAPKFPSKIGV
jgi:hypothetical protein